jgi:RHS repeat-associated protein
MMGAQTRKTSVSRHRPTGRFVAHALRGAVAVACVGLLITLTPAHADGGTAASSAVDMSAVTDQVRPQPRTHSGQSATQLADGTWLLLGGGAGSSTTNQAIVQSASGKAPSTLRALMGVARSGHSATLLPDGQVLILGGTGNTGAVLNSAERFDPASSTFTTLGAQGLLPRTGHTATVLVDGRVLIAGGVDAKGFGIQDVELYDPVSARVERLNAPLDAARMHHVAALLPDANVLLWGGTTPQGQSLTSGDLFDATAQRFQPVATDGARQLAGTLSQGGVPGVIDSLPATSATQVPVDQRLMVRFNKRLSVASLNATTVTLLGPSGPVKIRPVGVDGGVLLFVTPEQELLPDSAFTLFVQGATDEYGQSLPMVAIGFHTAALGSTGSAAAGAGTATVTTSTTAAAAVASAKASVPAASAALTTTVNEDDEVWTPSERNYHGDWRSGRRHLAELSKPNHPMVRWALHGNPQLLKLTPLQVANHKLPAPPQGPIGVTAVAGQVLRLNGKPLAGVTLTLGTHQVLTDANGEFLLNHVPTGHQVLVIDGASANRGQTHYGRYEYGMEVKAGQTNVLPFVSWMSVLDTKDVVNVPAPTTTMTVLTNPAIPGLELRIPAGTVIRDAQGKIVTQLSMTAIPVDQPPFPLPNFPVPVYFTVQPGGSHLLGIDAKSSKGAQIIYPNFSHAAPGTRMNFWDYDPTSRGWFMYGQGSVTADGKQVVPDPGVVIYELSGAMISTPGNAPPGGPSPGGGAPGGGSDGGGSNGGADGGGGAGGGASGDGAGAGDGGGSGGGGGGRGGACSTPGGGTGTGGDPVDLFTGLFTYERTDLSIKDVIPISVTRTYRQADETSRAFGIGTNISYDLFLVGDVFPYTYQYVILPNGGHVYFPRISPGTSYGDAVYQAQACPGSVFYGAVLRWDTSAPGSSWSVTLKSGTVYYFRDAYLSSNPRAAAVFRIHDRNGNTVSLARDGNYNVTQVTSPNGRNLFLTYDGSNRIIKATDDIGRIVKYDYDPSGRLQTITDPLLNKEQLAYQAQVVDPAKSIGGVSATTNLTTVTDRRGNPKITNTYDANGRVAKQVFADGSTYTFAYTLQAKAPPATVVVNGGDGTAGGNVSVVTQVDSVDERGTAIRHVFDANGYATSVITAVGLPEQQTHTYSRDPSTSLVNSETDALGRTTAYQYDAVGNVTQITRLSGTADAVNTVITYDPTYNNPTSIKDPNGNKTLLTYDALGNLTQTTDALGHSANVLVDTQGRPVSIQDALSHVAKFGYTGGDLTSTTDALGRTTQFFADSVGRVRSVTDPLNNPAYIAYDALDRIQTMTDAKGSVVRQTYDVNGNVLTQVDQNLNSTGFSYDSRNRMIASQDALLQTGSVVYEPGGNVKQTLDRKGQLSSVIVFDGLGRPVQTGYGASVATPGAFKSKVTNTWDAGDRLTQVVDTVSGTITRVYDGLDRLTSETTPQGSVSYTYDAGGRRSTMTVQGQPTVSYTWDVANRLTTIQQAAGAVNGNVVQTISFVYDNANRRTQTTLPNGIVAAYVYDDANELTSISYKTSGGTLIGDLTYTYDAGARRTSVGGSLANVQPGIAVSATTLDANNRLTKWGSQTLTYDANGNLTNDGSNTYTWDERNHLVGISGSVAASFKYDSFGRRISKTIGGVQTDFLYDGANAVQTVSGSTAVSMLNGLGIDELYASLSATQQLHLLTDGLGSTVALADATQAVVSRYAYDAYGNVSLTGSVTVSAQYTGRENDGTGLYYNRARYYSPRFGRFISEDPIGWASRQTNGYAYVGGNPISWTDPSGWAGEPPPGTPYPENIPGGPWTWSSNPQNSRGGNFQGPKPSGGGQRTSCTYAEPGPNNPDPYWKVNQPGGGTQRYNMAGQPITPDQAHPGPTAGEPSKPPGLLPPTTPWALFIYLITYSPPAY